MASYRDKLPATGGGFTLKSVQRGAASIPAGQTSVIVTIATIDTAKSFIKIYSSASQVGSEFMYSVMPRADITDSTTLTFSRGIGSVASQSVSVYWEVVEFESGVSVQKGSASTSNTSLDVTISTIDTSKSFLVFSASSVSSSQNLSSAHAALIVNSSTIRFIAPAAPTAATTFNWQVVSYV